ncbi:hypothetical protein WCLP8_4930002 [uncultured Gammaproteobacteria bacterium]
MLVAECGQYSDRIQRPLEGLETGRVSEPQRRFLDAVSRASGLAGVVRSPDEAIQQVGIITP